jgi:hypothetical protein
MNDKFYTDCTNFFKNEKSKIHHVTGHEGTEGVRNIALLFLKPRR